MSVHVYGVVRLGDSERGRVGWRVEAHNLCAGLTQQLLLPLQVLLVERRTRLHASAAHEPVAGPHLPVSHEWKGARRLVRRLGQLLGSAHLRAVPLLMRHGGHHIVSCHQLVGSRESAGVTVNSAAQCHVCRHVC